MKEAVIVFAIRSSSFTFALLTSVATLKARLERVVNASAAIVDHAFGLQLTEAERRELAGPTKK